MNYTEYVRTMQTMLVIPNDNADQAFQYILPRMIEYAELRIYREMDFLYTQKSSTTTLTANSRNATIPGDIFIVNELNVITPSSETDPDDGTRNPCLRVSLDWLNATWPSASTTGIPTQYALLDDTSVRLAPTPAEAYTAEFVGIYRPAPLSAANSTTFISQYIPDLLIQASLVFGYEYQQFPEMAQQAEAQYQALKAGVGLEDLRQKSQSAQWTAHQPSPIANLPRDRNG